MNGTKRTSHQLGDVVEEKIPDLPHSLREESGALTDQEDTRTRRRIYETRVYGRADKAVGAMALIFAAIATLGWVLPRILAVWSD